jgi:thymidylate synthase
MIYKDIDEAYREVLRDVYNNPDYRAAPRGMPIREKVDYAFTILNPTSAPIKTSDEERNKTIADYTNKEIALYDSGTNKVAEFAKASKFWDRLSNPDGTINSAYGFLIWKNYSCTSNFSDRAMTPWEWAKESLLADKDTRQAVMHFASGEHKWHGNKDQVCTLTGNWLIRDDKLNFTIVMRSQDMVKGAVYDWPWFCSLMDKMLVELKTAYPDLEKGRYTHICHSIHCYEKDKNIINSMLGISDGQG